MANTLGLVLICLSTNAIPVHYCKDLALVPSKESDPHREHKLQDGYLLKHSPCGRPPPGNVSRCQAYTKHPDCHSFPGKPHHVRIQQYLLNNTSPVLWVAWDISTTGFSDLWGFQVHLIEVSFYHPMGYFKCIQINSKDKTKLSVQFQGLSFGAKYVLRIQSMPPNDNHSNVITKQISTKDQCQIDQFKDRPICCEFSSVMCHVSDYKVLPLHGKQRISLNITWKLNCTDNLNEFKLSWEPDAPDYNMKCSGHAHIKNVSGYGIKLQGECTTFSLNYTGEIFGITAEQGKTKAHKFHFTIPEFATEISILPTTNYHSSPNVTVIAVVVGTGTVLGILLVSLVFGILKRRDSPLVRLENRPVVESDTEEMLSDPVKVLILHASCCMSCKKVIYCLWDVLDSTNLFDVRLDILSEPKINENPLRWYETQVKDVTRVLLVASRLMQMRDQNSEIRNMTTESDYVSISCQLNLLRGDLCNTREASKYVPAYMNYNGSKKDIPRFLSMCRSYNLAHDLEKVILHLLGLSSIRKHSNRPIVQVSSDSHPFSTKREAFVKAVHEAEQFHQQMQTTSGRPNLQENFVV